MSLIACTECGREISDKAPQCPGCGAPQQRLAPTFGAYVSGLVAPGEAPTKPKSNMGLILSLGIPAIVLVAILVVPHSPPKPERPPTDFTKPLFTRKFAAACPFSLLDDHREQLGMKAANEAIVTGIGMEKALRSAGCDVWREGVAVYLPPQFIPARDGLVHWLPMYENPQLIGVPTLIPDADLTN